MKLRSGSMLTSLGFRVVLSPKSDKHIEGLETIPRNPMLSRKLCGHIISLIENGVDTMSPSVV